MLNFSTKIRLGMLINVMLIKKKNRGHCVFKNKLPEKLELT